MIGTMSIAALLKWRGLKYDMILRKSLVLGLGSTIPNALNIHCDLLYRTMKDASV